MLNQIDVTLKIDLEEGQDNITEWIKNALQANGCKVLSISMLPDTISNVDQEDFASLKKGMSFYVKGQDKPIIAADDAFFNFDADEPDWEVKGEDGMNYSWFGVVGIDHDSLKHE